MGVALKVVFFDLFETLITEHDPSLCPPLSPAEYLSLDAACFRQEWRARWRERMTGVYPDYVSVLEDICRALNSPIDSARLAHLQASRLARKAVPFTCVDPAIVAVLHALRQAGLAIGVISNCTPEEVAAWPTSPLAACCHDVVFSYQAGCAKPDAAIYHLACRRLDIVPGEALFVGDGGNDELDGAAAVGMEAYQATWFLARRQATLPGRALSCQDARYPRLGTVADLHALVMARYGVPRYYGGSQC